MTFTSLTRTQEQLSYRGRKMVDVHLNHITKIFKRGKVQALKDLDMVIPDGKITCLLGPSGCGKTTTMRIIAGLERPTEGSVHFGDKDVTDLSPQERNVAMVFQTPVVYRGMSVYKNIAFPLTVRKMPQSEVDKKVKEVAETLGLTPILNEMADKLDAGGKQKTALARAIVRTPNVSLMDEPLTALDPDNRVALRAMIKELTRLGQTMVYVTHDQAEALTLADKIGVMQLGELVQYGSPEELYDKPSNTFVGWFIGDPGMNFIDCTFKETEKGAFLDSGSFTYDVSPLTKLVKEGSSGSELILGIRPEYVSVSSKKNEQFIASKCVVKEPLGNRVMLDLQVGEQMIRAKTPSLIDIDEGDEAFIFIPLDKVRIFNKNTKKAVV